MKPLLALWIMLAFGTMTLLLALPPPLLEGTDSVGYQARVNSRTYGWPHGWLTREEANPSGQGEPAIRWYICNWDRFATAATASVLGPGFLILPIMLVTRKRESLLVDQEES